MSFNFNIFLIFVILVDFHFFRSTSRYTDIEKPKKKKTLSATTSLVSIPNTIKLSMLNSGLLSFGKFPNVFPNRRTTPHMELLASTYILYGGRW